MTVVEDDHTEQADAPYGTCAFCDAPLPLSKSGRPRVICDSAECRRETSRYGARIVAARRRRQIEQDGAPDTRVCSACEQDKPLDRDHFYIDQGPGCDPPSREYDRWCIECRKRKSREDYARRRDELNARQRARRKELRKTKTPEQLAADRARKAEAARLYRRRHPDRVREQRRRALKKVRANPQLHAAYLENSRIARRVRREREGLSLDNQQYRPTRGPSARDDIRRLPAPPLAAILERRASKMAGEIDGPRADGAREAMCGQIGVTTRTLHRWRSHTDSLVLFDVADRILVALDLLWWEVWTPDSEHYPAAVRVWEGEDAYRDLTGAAA